MIRLRLAAALLLATALSEAGDSASIKVFEDVVVRRRRVLGDSDPETFASRLGHAQALHRFGRRREALKLLRNLLLEARTTLGPDHPYTASIQRVLDAL